MTAVAEPVDDNKFLSVFTPSQTASEDLEAILVQRHELLEDAIERVQESALTGNKHHLLYVGPRGSGKTHFVTLLVHKLGQRPDITKNLCIAWLNEDETSTTVLELLIKVHRALVKRYPDAYSANDIEPIYDLEPDEAKTCVTNILLDDVKLKGRTILIVVENLDALFDGLGDLGQKELRALIQEQPRFSIAATAQRLTNDLKNRDNPFFGFFQTYHLKPLSEDEATELLTKISLLRKRYQAAEFLGTRKGRSRVNALHHLSGGNHRMYIVLSQFITQDSIDALVPPFIKMVDELTPYYQERLRWLPAQQRKIVEFLSSSERPVTVKEIAKRLFASHQTISGQLKELRNKGYVTSSQRGRESLYEITEPLMRICVEAKENQNHKPLAILVDFIRAWYDHEDLTVRLEDKKLSTSASPYLMAAIEKNTAQENQTKQLQEAIESHLSEAFIHSMSDEPEKAISDYTAVIELENASVDQVAKALGNRGHSYGTLGDNQKEISDYTAVIELENVLVDDVAKALFNRGYRYGILGDNQKEISDYTAVIELENAPVDQVAKALGNRGLTYGTLGDNQKAISDYTAVIELEGAPLDSALRAQMFLAEVHIKEGRWVEGFASIADGLKLSVAPDFPEYHYIKDIIGIIFSAGLAPSIRHEHITELTRLYAKHEEVTVILGTGLIEHLGSLYQNKTELPSPENLDAWFTAWQQASQDVEKLRIPMRIFKTGIDFLKTGGQDQSIFLDLKESERSILKQAFGVEE